MVNRAVKMHQKTLCKKTNNTFRVVYAFGTGNPNPKPNASPNPNALSQIEIKLKPLPCSNFNTLVSQIIVEMSRNVYKKRSYLLARQYVTVLKLPSLYLLYRLGERARFWHTTGLHV